MVGFLDDNPAVRRRRVLGVKVLGAPGRGGRRSSRRARPGRGARHDPGRAGRSGCARVVAAARGGGRAVPARPPARRSRARSPLAEVHDRVSAADREAPAPRTLAAAARARTLLLAALYAWQAWQRQTPTLFSDEIEFTQISRSIAETGEAALRGGEPAPGVSLYAYLAAPAWWLDDVGDALRRRSSCSASSLMTAAIFPAYALARLVVSRPYALFAAVGDGGRAGARRTRRSSSRSRSPIPSSTLALLLIARAGIARRAWSIGLALAGLRCVAALVRAQLAVLLPVLVLVLLARAWRSERVRRWRATWTAGDWVGAAVLAGRRRRSCSRPRSASARTRWYARDRLLQGPDARVRPLGRRRARDRDRRAAAGRRRSRRSCAARGEPPDERRRPSSR